VVPTLKQSARATCLLPRLQAMRAGRRSRWTLERYVHQHALSFLGSEFALLTTVFCRDRILETRCEQRRDAIPRERVPLDNRRFLPIVDRAKMDLPGLLAAHLCQLATWRSGLPIGQLWHNNHTKMKSRH
jgi:hypothetical protein